MPGWVLMQSSLSHSAPNQPASHSHSDSADAPSPLVEAGGHASHAPISLWRVLLDHVPAAHGMATPAEHHEPAGHGSHCDLLLSPSKRPTVPASHGVGAEEPLPHQLCSVHSAHAVAPSSP